MMNWKIGRSVGRDTLNTAFFAGLKANGIDSVELSMPQDKYDTYDYAAIRRSAEEAGVDIFSFHLPFLFAALGAQEKTNYWAKKLALEAFNSGDAGYPGDEDNGTTSAWYIFATIGQYRLCPGKTEWIQCERLVKSVKILGKEI